MTQAEWFAELQEFVTEVSEIVEGADVTKEDLIQFAKNLMASKPVEGA